jgi:hypothetical protein
MEFFTLGPTPKIDFRSAQQQHTQQWLKRDSLSTITLQCNSLRTKEFNTKFLQFSSLGTSIYRLQVQLSVFLEKPRRRLDGRHKGSGWTTVRSAFQNFAEILSCFEPRLDGVAPSSGRSYFDCTQFPYQGFARSDQGNGRLDGWLDAHTFHISSSRVRTMKSGVRMSEFWMRYLPYGRARPDGNPHHIDGCNDLPISVLWKEIPQLVEHWVSSGRMQAGTVRSFSTQRKVRMESSRCSDIWCFGQLDVWMVYHVVWTVYHVVWTAAKDSIFLTCRLCRIF